MKHVVPSGVLFALITLFSGVFAQGMPACATQCLESSLKTQNTCTPTDTSCICTTQTLMDSIEGCVLSSCTTIEALSARNATQILCGHPARDISHILPVVGGVSGGLALAALLIRITMAGTRIALDDYFAIAAMAIATAMLSLQFVTTASGFGKDIWAIPAKNIYRIIQFTWLTEVFFFMAVTCTKLSFLVFLLRIFPRIEIRRLIYIFMGLTVAQGFAFTVACIFNCQPVTYIWQSWDGQHSGKCINLNLFAWVYGGLNILLDLGILAIPIPELLTLSLSPKKKVYIIMMFSVGIFTTIVAAVRLQTLVKFASSKNPTYDNVPTAYWAALEVFVGIFCICMPALRQFLAKLFPRWFSNSQAASGYEPYIGPNGTSRFTTVKSTNQRGSTNFALSNFGGAGIMKTMETKIERELDEDDETKLVGSERAGTSKEAWSRTGSEGDAESVKHVIDAAA